MSFNLDGYVDVAERVRIFREQYPTGSLQPADVSKPFTVVEIGSQTFIAYCAAAYRTPDDPRPGIGTAYEPVPGKTQFTKDSELQNAETAAWGRAIVAVLAADTQRIASAQEVRNRQTAPVDGERSALLARIAERGAKAGLPDVPSVVRHYADWADNAEATPGTATIEALREYADVLESLAAA